MFEHIVVPLDGSAVAEEALPVAVTLSQTYGSRLTLLRISTSNQIYLTEFTLGLPDAADLYSQLRLQAAMEAQSYLEEQVEKLAEAGISCSHTMVESTRIADGIVQAAEEVSADLIVMSTHGRSGFRRLLLGSVAEGVLRQSAIPVLLIPVPHIQNGD
jgi:nucleotide-binding universal stress UspA family protein